MFVFRNLQKITSIIFFILFGLDSFRVHPVHSFFQKKSILENKRQI